MSPTAAEIQRAVGNGLRKKTRDEAIDNLIEIGDLIPTETIDARNQIKTVYNMR